MKSATLMAAGFVIAVALPSTRVLTSRQNPARDATSAVVPSGTAELSGLVVSDDASAGPIRRARVTLNSLDRTVGRTTTTDDEGRFTFQALPAGRYLARATKSAYVAGVYGASKPGRPGTPLALADGQKLVGINIRMARGAVIAGRILGPDGNPPGNVALAIARYRYDGLTGLRTLGIPDGAVVRAPDETGAFRAYGLEPGEYVVAATVRPQTIGRGTVVETYQGTANVQQALAVAAARAAGQSSTAPPAGKTVSFAPVFFPGTVDAAAAATVTLAPGEERGGLNMTLQPVPVARIDGTVRPAPGTSPPPTVVTLTPVADQGFIDAGILRPQTARVDDRGAFQLSGIAPGRYTILAKTAAPNRGAPPLAPGSIYFAGADLTIDGRDVETSLELQPAMRVTGRVVFAGASPPPKPDDLAQMQILLQPYASGVQLNGPRSAIGADNRLEFGGLVPGPYALTLMLTRPLTGWTLKSATARGSDVLGSPLVMKAGEDIRDLVVTFTDHPSDLTGRLQDVTGRPAADYFIVAFSTTRAAWTPHSLQVQQARPGNDGVFHVVNLPAGEYWLAALIDVAPGDLSDPSFLESLIPNAIKLSIADGETKTQNLRIGR